MQKSEKSDLPQLRPFVYDVEQDKPQASTKEDTLTQNEDTLTEESTEVDKIALAEDKEKSVKPEKKKKDKYSTKGLIFIHNNEKDKNIKDSASSENNSVDELQPVKNLTPAPSNEFNFAPLDEIRVPDLDGKGYSIHSEYGAY